MSLKKKTKLSRVFNYRTQSLKGTWNAEEKDPAVVMLYDSIGGDPWTGEGVTAKDFKALLDELPHDGRELQCRINSKGGDVHEGMAICQHLSEWPGKTICIIDGVAASTASWIPTACSEVRAAKNSQIFVHDAIAFGMGNAEDFRKAADNLDKTSNQIAGMYADKTGESVEAMRDLMKNETLMTGEEAKEMGLVDTLIETKAVRNFSPEELTSMRNTLKAMNSARQGGGGQPRKDDIMNKAQIIALLAEHGVKVENTATDEQLQAALKQLLSKKTENADRSPDVETLKADIKALQEANKSMTQALNEARRIRITNTVEALVNNDQLPAGLKEKALARALGDESYLDELRSMPARRPGGDPLSAERVECTSESFADVQNFILANGPKFMQNFIGTRAGDRQELGKEGLMEVRNRSITVANTIRKHKDMLTSMFNTNTIDSNLQRTVILQEMLEQFAVILCRFDCFATNFSNVPLEGTDTVAVPFYDLAADAGNSWNPATGYATMGNTTTGVRTVAVGGSGTSSGSSAAANTAKDRKWVGLEFSSYELARQPYVNWQKHAGQKANRLGVLIFTDVVSRVITAANFGAAIKTVPAAGFSADDVADLWASATGANWPDTGRSLTVNHTYWQALIKDPAFKQYLASGSTETIRKAQISEAYGFQNMIPVPNLTNYSPTNENLVGWINWMYAVLMATAPIMPTSEVRALMTRYDIVTDPKTGITFEYRRFGNTTLDKTQEVIECSYGAAKGVASALYRLTSA